MPEDFTLEGHMMSALLKTKGDTGVLDSDWVESSSEKEIQGQFNA
ncbi:hypothetical protein FHS15_004211 [Paenibacillus castaneae]|nr:hypothetical protein [Paenibacillus castaneae]